MSKLEQSKELIELLVKSGSDNMAESIAATRELAIALTLPLRQGVMPGDILAGIYERTVLAPGAPPEYPLDFVSPGTEKDFVAYTLPNHGYIPQRNVEGDYVTVPTFEVGNAIDWTLRYARNARWDIVSRAMQVFQAGFTKKDNDDGWHTILAAAVDRNILVYDGDATAGFFTKRLVSLAKTVMRRNGGGNSSSINRGELTDIYMSPECLEDIRDWQVDQIDDVTRNQIFNNPDGTLNRIFSVNLHVIDEFGEDQEYQNYFTNQLSGTLASGDLELIIGLDLRNRDAFVSPVRQELSVFEDAALHRQRRAGLYGWKESGWAVLDSRRAIAMSC
jgi:hypothetical protein